MTAPFPHISVSPNSSNTQGIKKDKRFLFIKTIDIDRLLKKKNRLFFGGALTLVRYQPLLFLLRLEKSLVYPPGIL